MILSNNQEAFLMKLNSDLNIISLNTALPIESRINSLITLISNPIFDELAQIPRINSYAFDFSNGITVNFKSIAGIAAQLFSNFSSSIPSDKLKIFSSLATYTAVLAGFKNPMIPIMGKGPKAVILTLCHNSGEALHNTVKSVLSQTYWNFDYILADNASTDDTRERILEIEKSDPRVHHIFFDENKFPDVYVELIPKILENPEYKYFAICDHDDELFPKFLEISVNEALTENADLVFGGEQYVYPDNGDYYLEINTEKMSIDTQKSFEKYLRYFIYYTGWFGILFNTELLKITDYSSHITLVRDHDRVFVLDAIQKCIKAVIIPKCFFRHFINDNSGSMILDRRNLNATEIHYKKLLEVYDNRAGKNENSRIDYNNEISCFLLQLLLGCYFSMTRFTINNEFVFFLLGYFDKHIFYNKLIKYKLQLGERFNEFVSHIIINRNHFKEFAYENQKQRIDYLCNVLESEIININA
jgi:glycosyltransferase involved in cell wall biosynthesis